MSASETPTLYEWAGGGPAIRRLIDRFYDRVEGDDLLSPSTSSQYLRESRGGVLGVPGWTR